MGKLDCLINKLLPYPSKTVKSSHARWFTFPNPGNFASGIHNPGFGILNLAQAIQILAINSWNLESLFHWQRIRNPVPAIQNSWRGIHPICGLHRSARSWRFCWRARDRATCRATRSNGLSQHINKTVSFASHWKLFPIQFVLKNLRRGMLIQLFSLRNVVSLSSNCYQPCIRKCCLLRQQSKHFCKLLQEDRICDSRPKHW